MWRTIPVVILTLLMTGCATYRAPQGDDVATLTVQFKNLGVTYIDGERTTSELTVEGLREVPVSAGKHTVGVIALLGTAFAEAELWFVAEPKGTYVLTYDYEKRRVAFWIVDKSTGRPTGGVKGSDDEPPDSIVLPNGQPSSSRSRPNTI
jgi:hypothetical protein